MSKGHRRFAAFWDWQARHESQRERDLRAEVAGAARGRTLELGYGVGTNWPFIPKNVEYTGIEPDPYMRERAVGRVPAGREFTLLQGDAQSLQFEDGSFDTVLATLVFCTIQEPEHALAELRRVLRPDGQFVFFEHVRAHSRFGAAIQSGLTPIYRRLAGGCHLNRDTQAATEAAGFDTTVRRMKIGALPVIVGVAHKRA